ncbi:MAG: hypothetical protein ACK5SI_06875, partial [Planctomycetia bacterium]
MHAATNLVVGQRILEHLAGEVVAEILAKESAHPRLGSARVIEQAPDVSADGIPVGEAAGVGEGEQVRHPGLRQRVAQG